MNDGLRPYSDYKSSAMPWLGRIPMHWTEKRAKYFFREVDERSTTGEEPLMSVSHKTGVTPRKSNVTMFRAESNAGYKICRPGDLAINTLWAWMAALGVSRQTGLVSPAYGVYRQRDSSDLHPEYIDYLLRTPQYSAEYRCRSTGITASRLRLYPIDFLCIPLVQPPREEQELIVRYLRQQDLRIRKFIRNRRRLIEVLTEQKQAIINRAVTGGIGSNVSPKPSGVDWLGSVPPHWNVLRSKYVFKEIDLRSLAGEETHLSMTQRHGLIRSADVVERRLMSDSYAGGKLCRKDDLVLNRLKAHLGVFAMAPESGVVSPDYTVFRAVAQVCPKFYEYLYRTPLCRTELRRRAKGIVEGFWRLYTDDFYNIRVPLPPLAEQNEIVNELDRTLFQLNAAVEKAIREMDLILAYRTRLIADVVTGKLDVRHVAPPPVSVEPYDGSELDSDDEFDEGLDEGGELDPAEEAVDVLKNSC